MVQTRAASRIQRSNLTPNNNSGFDSSESSDGDHEDIPNTAGPVATPKRRPGRPSTKRARSLADPNPTVDQGPKKRQRAFNAARPAPKSSPPAPTRAARLRKSIPTRNDSGTSTDDYVPVGLVNSLNAALRQQEVKPDPNDANGMLHEREANEQIHNEARRRESSGAKTTAGGLYPELHDPEYEMVIQETGHDPDDELQKSILPDRNSQSEEEVSETEGQGEGAGEGEASEREESEELFVRSHDSGSPFQQDEEANQQVLLEALKEQADIWEAPSSPINPTIPAQTSTTAHSERTRSREQATGGRPGQKVPKTRTNARTTKASRDLTSINGETFQENNDSRSHSRNGHQLQSNLYPTIEPADSDFEPALGSHQNVHEDLAVSDGDPDLGVDPNDESGDIDESDASSDISENIEGVESDRDDQTDVDLSAQETFEHDVEVFRSQPKRSNPKAKDAFRGPRRNDLTAIFLNYAPLRDLCALMRRLAWAGLKGDWQWRPFDADGARSIPGLTLVALLEKLERLYQEAPRAPRLQEQNAFFSDYADLVDHYLSQIELVVRHIREKRLAGLRHNRSPLNLNPKKRMQMTEELVHFLIPMLLHTLARVWKLAGDSWYRTAFTGCTTDLLTRTVGWITLLYRPLIEEQQRVLHDEESLSYQRGRGEWRSKLKQWQEFEKIMNELLQVIHRAPDHLVKEERHLQRQAYDRKQRQRMERIAAARRRLADEERQKEIQEQARRSLMSVRTLRSSMPESPSRPSSTPRDPASPRASSFPNWPDWTREEKMFIVKKLQDSYPLIPDLRNCCFELNKTLVDVEKMTRALLEALLATACPQQTAAGRVAKADSMMDAYHRRKTLPDY
ncbi:hypothetical protein F4780DRAFT_140306 [Xylariomycetidae sp. FL0641]|nr:hypothetical protein F4780DRAFT_140306 [Xylariomycetidae sp. FL0641]